jgi:predicted transcriptional regulator
MAELAQDAPRDEFIGAYVDTLTRAELLALARREDRSLSSVIRRALREFLDRGDNEKETP